MTSELVSAFVNLGAVGLILWWMTQKLVPELQMERSKVIEAFQSEARAEREAHERSVDKVVVQMQERDRYWMELVKELLESKL